MSREIVKLGDILQYEQPSKYIVKTENYSNKYKTPVLTAGKTFILGFTNEPEGIFTNLPVIIFDDFTTASKYVDFPFKVKSSAMKILKAKEEIVDIKFIFYLMKTLNVNSTQHKRYWISKFANIRLSLPALAIQKRIAEILDGANELNRIDQYLLKKYDELTQSIFLDLFGDPEVNEKNWDIKKLDQVIEFPSGLVDPKSLPYSEMIHVGGDNVESHSGKLIGLKKARELSLKSGKFYFTDKHILYNKIRPYLNKVAAPNFEGICSADMYPLMPKKNILTKEYLYFILKSKSFLDYADKQSRRANIPKINMNEMSLFEFPVPPIAIQNDFTSKYNQLACLIQNVTEISIKSTSLFNKLLQTSFYETTIEP